MGQRSTPVGGGPEPSEVVVEGDFAAEISTPDGRNTTPDFAKLVCCTGRFPEISFFDSESLEGIDSLTIPTTGRSGGYLPGGSCVQIFDPEASGAGPYLAVNFGRAGGALGYRVYGFFFDVGAERPENADGRSEIGIVLLWGNLFSSCRTYGGLRPLLVTDDAQVFDGRPSKSGTSLAILWSARLEPGAVATFYDRTEGKAEAIIGRWSPDAKMKSFLCLCDLEQNEVVCTYRRHTDPVLDVAVDPEHRVVFSSTKRETHVSSWNASRCLQTIPTGVLEPSAGSVCVANDQNLLLLANYGTVVVYDLRKLGPSSLKTIQIDEGMEDIGDNSVIGIRRTQDRYLCACADFLAIWSVNKGVDNRVKCKGRIHSVCHLKDDDGLYLEIKDCDFGERVQFVLEMIPSYLYEIRRVCCRERVLWVHSSYLVR